MKKLFIAVTILCISILSVGSTAINQKNTLSSRVASQNTAINSFLIIREPEDQLYRDLLITLLYPHVEKAIDDYYDEYMTYLPHEDPWSYKFITIEKTPGPNYTYIIQLEVMPYVGPHLSVGKDRITLQVDLKGVSVEKFEHLQSYGLPAHYENIIKKKLPNS